MTTQRSEADEVPTLAERVMHPDAANEDTATEPVTPEPVTPEPQTTEPQTTEPVTSTAATDQTPTDVADEPETAPEPDPEDPPVTVDQTVDQTEADRLDDRPTTSETDETTDRTATQVLPGGPEDDEPTRIVPAVVDDTADDPTATRPMPAVDGDAAGSESARSTDRDAARARSEARSRPADDPYENLYAPASQATPAPVGFAGVGAAAVEPEPQVIRRIVRGKPTTDRFNGALALFVLRLVVAAIALAHGAQKLLNLGAARDFFGQTQIPYPEWAALATGIGEVLIAGALLIGLLVRVAGFGLLVVSVGALVFVQWAPFTLFRGDVQGFVGEKELVLAAVGLLFLLVGGGGWGADRMFRSAKSKGLVEEDET